MGFKEFWSGVKKNAPGLIGRGLMGAFTAAAPAIDSIIAPYTAGVPLASTITNAGIGYLQRNARESAWDRQNKKNELYNQAYGQSLQGEQAKAYVKERLGKKGFGTKMFRGMAQQQMIKLPAAQENASNGHAAVGYSISPSGNHPSINSRFNSRPRRKKLG